MTSSFLTYQAIFIADEFQSRSEESTLLDQPDPGQEIPDRISRYLDLANIALLDAVREEVRRVKDRIRPSVERYNQIMGTQR